MAERLKGVYRDGGSAAAGVGPGTAGLRGEFDDVGITTPGGKDEPGDSDRQSKTPGAGAAWVDEDYACSLLHKRPVGVAGKHGEMGSAKRIDCLGPHETVAIGDDSDNAPLRLGIRVP